jgi:hypothetical protein
MKIVIALVASAALAGCVGYVPYGAGYAGGAYYGNSQYGEGSVYYGNGPYVVPPVPENRYGDGYRRWHGDRDYDRDRDRDRRDFRRY